MHPSPTDALDTGSLYDLADDCPAVLASAAMARQGSGLTVPDDASALVGDVFFV